VTKNSATVHSYQLLYNGGGGGILGSPIFKQHRYHIFIDHGLTYIMKFLALPLDEMLHAWTPAVMYFPLSVTYDIMSMVLTELQYSRSIACAKPVVSEVPLQYFLFLNIYSSHPARCLPLHYLLQLHRSVCSFTLSHFYNCHGLSLSRSIGQYIFFITLHLIGEQLIFLISLSFFYSFFLSPVRYDITIFHYRYHT
jgi:hypothetical protein